MMQHLWCHPVRRWRVSMVTRMSSLSVCVCVCGRGREFPWLSVSSSLCLLCMHCALCVAVLSAVRCDEAVHIAVQKAQGQHNPIPLASVCLSVWLRGSPADRFCLPDWIIRAQAANVAAHETRKLHVCIVVVAVSFLACVFICLHCSRRASVDVGCFCHWWSSGRSPSESAGVGCAACIHALCARVCPMIKQGPFVSLTVFTVQLAFRVQLGWVLIKYWICLPVIFTFLISYCHSCAHSEVLCESLHSVFPSGRMHLFPIATVDNMLPDRISAGPFLDNDNSTDGLMWEKKWSVQPSIKTHTFNMKTGDSENKITTDTLLSWVEYLKVVASRQWCRSNWDWVGLPSNTPTGFAYHFILTLRELIT